MTWELNRRRFVRVVTTTYFFGRVPLVNVLVMLFHLALLARLASRYNAYYEARPVLTMMVTNAILHGIADTVAQTVSAVLARCRAGAAALPIINMTDDIPMHRLPTTPSHKIKSSVVLGEKELLAGTGIGIDPAAHHFDFERLSRFAAYGFAFAPLQYRWFGFLSRVFPMVNGRGAFTQSLKRVIFDQLVYAPFGLTLFFTVMTIAEGGGRRAISSKMRDMYVPTLKANYILWPAVQIINFRLMPVQFQLPVASSVGIAWTAYLSLTNNAAEEPDPRVSPIPSARVRQV